MYSFSPIDRQSEIRHQSARVDKILNEEDSLALLWYKGKLISAEGRKLYFLTNELTGFDEYLSPPIYLGKHDNQFYFSYQLEQWHEEFDSLELFSLRAASQFVSDHHLGMLFYSQGLLNWHYNHQFCALCGNKTEILQSGHSRKCINSKCEKEHFPRIEPAVIFTIINSSDNVQRILLARQASWDKNRYSVLAGFVEPGESLEDAVKREAYEEVGLKVNRVEYAGSQPWPFPGSLMVGFNCYSEQETITLIDQELEHAGWYSADELEVSLTNGDLKMPFSVSISWFLIDQWFMQQKGYSLESLVNNEIKKKN